MIIGKIVTFIGIILTSLLSLFNYGKLPNSVFLSVISIVGVLLFLIGLILFSIGLIFRNHLS